MIAASPPPLTSAEVAELFRVDARTVTRWAEKGRIGSFRTPGGHRRFHRADVLALLAPPQEEGGDR